MMNFRPTVGTVRPVGSSGHGSRPTGPICSGIFRASKHRGLRRSFAGACERPGATKDEFLFHPRHAVFVHWAIANEKAGTGLFRAVRYDAAPPEVGDLVHWNQPGGTFDFPHATTEDSYPSHSAIVVALGQDDDGRFAMTIGGNENDSVGRTRVRLNIAGSIVQRANSPFISLVRTLK